MAAMATLLLGSACQRETISGPASSPVAQENLTPRIAAFVALAQHGASASRGAAPYSADSAAWYVEGALNYSLAQPWLPYNELVSDSLTVALASAGGTVNTGDAANAYLALAGQLQQALSGEDPHLIVVDAEPHATPEGLELKVRYTMGQGHERLALNTTYPANASLFFMTGGGMTSCDPSFYSPYAADKVIQNRVAATIPLLAVGQYYASVETWYVDAYGATDLSYNHFYSGDFQNTGNTSGHSNQDYKLYLCGNGSCSTCLDAGDMSVHTQGTYDVMHWINQQYCPSKVPASISVHGDFPVGTGPYIHAATYTYGKPQHELGYQ